MKIQLSILNKILIFLSFFFIGYYRFDISIFLFVLTIICSIRGFRESSIILQKKLLLFTFLLISFYIFLIGFGAVNNLYNFQYYKGEIFAVLTFLLLGYFSFYLNTSEVRLFGFFGLIFGLFSYSVYCLWYTKFVIGLDNAYSKVWNPYAQAFDNSPSHAMNLGVIACLSLYYIIYSRNKFCKILFLLIFLISIYSGLYTGSRFFILLIPMSFIIYLLVNYSLKKSIKYIVFSIVVLMPLIFFLDGSKSNDLSSMGRIMTQGFDDSGRFKLIYLGMVNLVEYPFGGYLIDKSVYITGWNHNIFFDIARIGGLIPLALFISSLLVLLKIILEKQTQGIMVYMLIVMFLIFQQDVIFTGNYMLFLIFSFAGYIVANKDFNVGVK